MQKSLAESYLKYLECIRLPDDLPADAEESAAVLRSIQERVLNNPYIDASDDLDELIATEPQSAWPLLGGIVERCDDRDTSMLGAGVLQTFTQMHAAAYASAIESAIRSSDRFFHAFQYVAMTGVPLAIQHRLNAALLERGADPKLVVEYDESEDEPE